MMNPVESATGRETQTNTNANAVTNASSRLKAADRRFHTDEAPVMPDERRAEIAKRWYDWAEQQKAKGDPVPDEEIERLIDNELKEIIG